MVVNKSTSSITKNFKEVSMEKMATHLVSIKLAEGILKYAETQTDGLTEEMQYVISRQIEHASKRLALIMSKPKLELYECSSTVLDVLNKPIVNDVQMQTTSTGAKRTNEHPSPVTDVLKNNQVMTDIGGEHWHETGGHACKRRDVPEEVLKCKEHSASCVRQTKQNSVFCQIL